MEEKKISVFLNGNSNSTDYFDGKLCQALLQLTTWRSINESINEIYEQHLIFNQMFIFLSEDNIFTKEMAI